MYPTISHLLKDLTGLCIPAPIQTFGFFVSLSIILSYYVLKRELKLKSDNGLLKRSFDKHMTYKGPADRAGAIVFLGIIFGVIGARLFSILEYPETFLEAPLYILFSSSGFNFYGGLILGSIPVIIYAVKIRLNIIHLLDATAPALMAGYAIGRLGCHLSGDGHWGIANTFTKPNWLSFLPDWLWAYKYPNNVIEEGIIIPGCHEKYCTELGTPVFPTPIYDTLFFAIAFVILWNLRKKISAPGIVFSIYLIINGTERFLIEQISVNAEYEVSSLYFKPIEIISILFIITGVLSFYVLFNKHKNHKFKYMNKL